MEGKREGGQVAWKGRVNGNLFEFMRPSPEAEFIDPAISSSERQKAIACMDDDGRSDVRHWDVAFQSSMREHHQHHHNQGYRFMSVLADRDSSLFERNSSLSDKKSGYSGKESAMLQRDVVYVDRNNTALQRDASVYACDYPRDAAMWNAQRNMPPATLATAKILQVFAENPQFSSREYYSGRPTAVAFPANFFESRPAEDSHRPPKDDQRKREGEKEGPSKSSDKFEPKLSRPKKQKKQANSSQAGGLNGEFVLPKKEQKNLDVVVNGVLVDISAMPIPVCSCTGAPQQCYRWGNGGWQSACCTTSVSMYPLPLNPKRRGARVAGRKMSGGAFKKLLERLGSEGHNLSYPIDLKHYWAKHGTNKFVTIR